MPTKIVVLCSLLLLQCFLGECVKSRLDGYGALPIIPAELLALKNYGAVDFLSSPIIESIKPNILSSFPATFEPEVACENLFINSNPGMSISSPVSLEVPYVNNQIIPLSPLILETPLTLFDTSAIEPYIINPIETSYELNPYAVSVPNCISPVVSNLYIEEAAPFVIANLPSVEVPVLAFANTGTIGKCQYWVNNKVFTFAELNPFVNPNTLSILTTLSPILEVPSNNFYVPAIEMPTISQVIPYSAANLEPAVDVLCPMLYEVPLAIELPVNLNSYTGPTPLAVELPVIENIPIYAKSQIPVPTLSSESIASIDANIRSKFPSLPTLPPSSRVRSLGGISISELSASKGSGLFVTTSSPKRPTGISIRSENTYQGPVSVTGILPFLGTVGFSGSLPSSGYGTVNYRCGSGNVGILSEAPNILNSFYPRT